MLFLPRQPHPGWFVRSACKVKQGFRRKPLNPEWTLATAKLPHLQDTAMHSHTQELSGVLNCRGRAPRAPLSLTAYKPPSRMAVGSAM
jgi:hypothetical protein